VYLSCFSDKLFEFHPPYDVRGMLGSLVFFVVLSVALSALVAFLLLYIRRLKRKGNFDDKCIKMIVMCRHQSKIPAFTFLTVVFVLSHLNLSVVLHNPLKHHLLDL